MNGWIEAFVPFLATAREPLTTNVIPSVWIAIELLVAIGSAVWLGKKRSALSQNLRDMSNALRELEKVDLSSGYEQVSSQLRGDETVGDAWGRFEQTVHREQLPDGRVSLRRTVDSQEVFDDAVLGRHLNIRYYNAVPGLLTSLGILGTFVGLTYGLAQVQGTFGDTALLKQGIEDLLKGASIAFSTSVWGIFLSICFSLFEKGQFKRLRGELSVVQTMINVVIPRTNSEEWLSKISSEAGQQTGELKRFNTDLATSIAQALDEKISARITPAMEQLVDAVNSLSEFKQESSVEAVQQLAREFTQGLTQGSSQNIQDLNEVLTGVNTTLTATIENSTKNQQRLEDSLEGHLGNLSSKMESVLSALAASQSDLQETTGRGMSQMLSQIQEAIETQQHAFGDVSSRMTNEMQEQTERIADVVAGLARDVGQQTQQSTEFSVERMRGLAERLDSQIGETSKRFESEREHLDQIVGRVRELLQHLEEVTMGIGMAGESLRDTAQPLQQSTETLNLSLTNLRQTQSQLAETVTQAERRSVEQLSNAQQSAELIQGALQETAASWTAYKDQFGNLRGELEEVLNALNLGLGTYTQTTRDGITGYLREFD